MFVCILFATSTHILRGRIQGFPVQMILYIWDDVINSIPRVLRRGGGEELYNRFCAGPFGCILEIRRRGSTNNALHELMARELTDDDLSDHERWFHVDRCDIQFSAREIHK